MSWGRFTFGLILAWYDFYVGFFIDKPKRRLYFFPFPCIGIVIEWSGKMGDAGVRDPDNPCIDFEPGSPSGDCDTDGHYLCLRCRKSVQHSDW